LVTEKGVNNSVCCVKESVLAIRKVGTKIIVIAALLVCTFFVNGCAPTFGQIYQRADTIPDNMGMVYIYRPSRFEGALGSYNVWVVAKVEYHWVATPIVTLANGYYFPYLSEPGEVEFRGYSNYWWLSSRTVTLDIKAGETYYIKGLIPAHWYKVLPPSLEVVSQEVAENEISQCRLIPDPMFTTAQGGNELLGVIGTGAEIAPLFITITPACFF
jgi:hypothetical protein